MTTGRCEAFYLADAHEPSSPLGPWVGMVPPFRLGQLHLPMEVGTCLQQETSAFPSSVMVVIKIFQYLVLRLVSAPYGQTDRNTWTGTGSGSGHQCP